MTRLPRFLALAAAMLILAVAGLADGQVVNKERQAPRAVQPQIPSLPGFWQLRMKNVQEELEIVPEQIEELKALGKDYYEQMRAQQADWSNFAKMTQEQRQAKYNQLKEKREAQADEIRKKIEKVLLPHQLKALQDINLRAVGASMLAQPRIAKSLSLSDDQKGKLQQLRQELMEEYQQLRKKSFEKTLQVLTPEQREKLKEQIQNRGY